MKSKRFVRADWEGRQSMTSGRKSLKRGTKGVMVFLSEVSVRMASPTYHALLERSRQSPSLREDLSDLLATVNGSHIKLRLVFHHGRNGKRLSLVVDSRRGVINLGTRYHTSGP